MNDGDAKRIFIVWQDDVMFAIYDEDMFDNEYKKYLHPFRTFSWMPGISIGCYEINGELRIQNVYAADGGFEILL